MLDFPRWKQFIIIMIIIGGGVFAAPNFIGGGMDNLENQQDGFWGKSLNLGLDLQGGAHLLLAVDTDSVLSDRLNMLEADIRENLRKKRIRYGNLKTNAETVEFILRDKNDLLEATKIIRDIHPGSIVDIDEGAARFTLSFTDDYILEINNSALEQSVEIIRRRVDELGTREPVIQRQGADRIIVQVPGVKNPERLKNTIGKTARLTFHLVAKNYPPGSNVPKTPPPGSMILPSKEGGEMVIERRVRVSGNNLEDSQPAFDNNQPVVSFRFDGLGARKFGKVTQENVNRNLAIVLDDEVISAPNIREAILGGSGIITGSFSVPEAQDLSLLLRAGALPAPISVLEERTVGPGLGADSIMAGKLASMIGLIAVVIFMIVTYGLFGLFATGALFINLLLIVAILSALQATLTLPGIAGIVLTIGMAVDANVLIFERIAEEFKAGRTVLKSIDSGYKRALATILDSNLTTLIAGILLFSFGSGPIKGFAVTLSVGIVTSFFAAIMVTRWMVVLWFKRKPRKTLPILG